MAETQIDAAASLLEQAYEKIGALWRVVAALRDWYPNEVDAALEAEGLELD